MFSFSFGNKNISFRNMESNYCVCDWIVRCYKYAILTPGNQNFLAINEGNSNSRSIHKDFLKFSC